MLKEPKVLSIVGNRPQFIKTALVSEELKKAKIREVLLHTGQHYDFEMSHLFFKELKIKNPDYYLGIGSGSHAEQTGKMIMSIEPILIKEKPQLVIVHGDTNSTLAGALTASKLKFKVAHVEAGPRIDDMSIPEEVNRAITDRISDFLFCPTRSSLKNLRNEGLHQKSFLTGDVMIDMLIKHKTKASQSTILKKKKLVPFEYMLLTLHRPENVDNHLKLRRILDSANELGKKVVFPVHPRTHKSLRNVSNIHTQYKNIILLKPCGYFDFLKLESQALFIFTDSGGVQKEAYFFMRPCVTLFHKSPWSETLKSKWNKLLEPDRDVLKNYIRRFTFPKSHPDFFGKGNASSKIVRIIKDVIML